ncbi:SAM-dependent methyltransferase [Paenibacillus sp. CAA11]|uniref:SAM-dependent methyltransferase n=1 Tax=Paenibacillus sp. CAA11 TaxID=1532905 RepID=UPI000D3BD934|nr:SAM-dependent methyltransferase [Paenibacillus sp. CAA11]AWB44863.1 SAM-dependent methyltransferase [Paenibacillus sp. CAA11]
MMLNENIDATASEFTGSQFICTANHGFASYAQEELRRTFGSVKSRVLEQGEVFLATLPVVREEAVRRLVDENPVFLRHWFPLDVQISFDELDSADEAVSAVVDFASGNSMLDASRIVIQARKASSSGWKGTALELKERLEERINITGAQFVVKDADWTLSVYAAGGFLYAGISKPEANLSDWNGGAVRFQREEGQISRAKFKLLEAERTFGIDFTSFHSALDIGAAPGGWTSFLLERGLKVTAVDPANMHPSLLNHPDLTYLKRNADSVKFRDNQFDLLVCDMSWSPKLTVKLVTELLYSLVPGGTAVVTIKLLSKKPLALIREVIQLYEDANMQIQRAKQLFHNRDEITLYMIKY